MPVNVLWFRHGLRLHDNPSLHEAIKRLKKSNENVEENKIKLLPIFIFDGETAGTKLCGYNRFQFLLECLQDLDEQLKEAGGGLVLARGKPLDVFKKIHRHLGIANLCFEQDCEPVWRVRDEEVTSWCIEKEIPFIEKVGHTLWNPHQVIKENGGTPPLTFSMFNHVVKAIGDPDRPLPDVDLNSIPFAEVEESLATNINLISEFPTPEDFGYSASEAGLAKVYKGGERIALKQLNVRLDIEAKAFTKGSFLPNQRNPDILCPPKSLSPDLRFGSLSIRKFYWGVMDAFKATQEGTRKPFNPQIVAQLVWREFFYTMSVNNDHYDEMEANDICLNIPWYPHDDNDKWDAFVDAKTGYPFIDAGMRQLYKEGWIHHIVRNALACFLTRGDLWISWEAGLKIFLENLLDADWSVCAGNWMWISSSAFEQVLNCSTCFDPTTYGRRADPWGEYIKKYVPELAKYPVEYIYEPWKAPIKVQQEAGCIIGKDYPERIVDHDRASKENAKKMTDLKNSLMRHMCQVPLHCAPSDEKETREFMSLPDECCHNTVGASCTDGVNES